MLYLLRIVFLLPLILLGSMTGGTIGSRRALVIDGDKDRYIRAGDFHGECRAHGVKAKITAQQIDDWAEAELARKMDAGWNYGDCPMCHERVSAKGTCSCGTMTYEERIRVHVLGEPIPNREPADIVGTDLEETPRRVRPLWVPTSAEMPDLPDDATPEQIQEWREHYRRMREFREAQLENTYTPDDLLDYQANRPTEPW